MPSSAWGQGRAGRGQGVPGRAGRRGAVVRRAVLAATLAELGEGGYASLGIERVAARAGVHKTTVYRRWPDRESLVTDALLELAADDFAIPDTGDVDRDLLSSR